MKGDTILLRQIHPTFVQQGRVTSQAFRPTPKDENRLSAYDGDQIGPEPAWHHFTAVLGFASVGVMGVNVAECAALHLPVEPDPEPFPEHVVIDFSGMDKPAIEKLAKKLRSIADARGWLYQAAFFPPR
ncbi:hypothetical protein [Longimicrobium sp.]|uniref:hypothetical protein n=1 Tax=Longimicrobium sp. TaxID=2029185 RepID=UPI002E2EEF28|nr:hypothetical protein [Longimicrobium sp.]HEX6041512.1 hypothetical protein [Longimicrobium sp.]